MKNSGLNFMEVATNTMAGVILNDTKPIRFDVIFNGASNVKERIACFHLADSSH